MSAVLAFDDVSRVFGIGEAAVTALDRVTWTLHAGELVAIMGPSGSGKSTLLALAGALDEPTHGTISVHARSLASCTAAQRAELRRRTLGFVFQDDNLVPGLTALENTSLPLELDGVARNEARTRGLAALEAVALTGLAQRFPAELSGGQRQRVAIARAFVGERDILLADEPTGALDTLVGEHVMRLLRGHCDAGKSAVVVTHDAAHAAWADRVLSLRDGRLADLSLASGADE